MGLCVGVCMYVRDWVVWRGCSLMGVFCVWVNIQVCVSACFFKLAFLFLSKIFTFWEPRTNYSNEKKSQKSQKEAFNDSFPFWPFVVIGDKCPFLLLKRLKKAALLLEKFRHLVVTFFESTLVQKLEFSNRSEVRFLLKEKNLKPPISYSGPPLIVFR